MGGSPIRAVQEALGVVPIFGGHPLPFPETSGSKLEEVAVSLGIRHRQLKDALEYVGAPVTSDMSFSDMLDTVELLGVD